MELRTVAIVGAGPAGLAAARGYREAGGEARVILLAEEAFPPYRRPPLSKDFLRGDAEESELWLEPQSWYDEHAVELRLDTPVAAVDLERQTLLLGDGDALSVDACVLATGSQPVRPPVPGAQDGEVMVLRRLPDSRAIRDRARAGTRVAVLGSGFIGCEAAASLAARGATVTVVSQESQPLVTRLGEEAGSRIRDWLQASGVTFIGDAEVIGIADATRLRLRSRPDIEADLVLLGAGTQPRTELAEDCGLELEQGAVRVDERLRSSAPFVLAAGDVAFAHNRSAGRHIRIEHWGDALGQGELAGRVLAGESAIWDAVPGFWSTIGAHTLKHASWGDGFDRSRLIAHAGGAFTVWYEREGIVSGVLTHDCDEDYERGRQLIAQGATAR